VLLTTHYMEEAERLCDSLLIMDKGRKILEGSPRHLLEEHIEKYVLEVYEDKVAAVLVSKKTAAGCAGTDQRPPCILLEPPVGSEEDVRSMHSGGYNIRQSNLEDLFLKATGGNSMPSNRLPSLISRITSVCTAHAGIHEKPDQQRTAALHGAPDFFWPESTWLGKYIANHGRLPYIQFLASGLLVTSAMYTSAFELSYGTFIRLEFDKVYDGMLAAPISVNNLLMGEILWAGTKAGFFRSRF